MKTLYTFLFTFLGIALHAEYDEYYYEISMLIEEKPQHMYEYQVYFVHFKEMSPSATIDDWKELFTGSIGENEKVTFYSRFFEFNVRDSFHSPGEGEFYYGVADTMNVDISGLKSIELKSIHRSSLLYGIYNDLTRDDFDWLNMPYIKQQYFSVPHNMCNDCVDIIFPTFQLYIYEESESLNQHLAYLTAIVSTYEDRVIQIENDWGYLNENCPEYIELINVTFPFFAEAIRLLEREKVLIILDSGW